MSYDEDDKKTVVIDLNALKKQKLLQEEQLEKVVSDLAFALPDGEEIVPTAAAKSKAPIAKAAPAAAPTHEKFPVIFFDYQSDFFQKSLAALPNGFQYYVVSSLEDLNVHLKSKKFQVVAFNYDVNPKVTNQLTAQIKIKFPFTKTLIMAKAISPAKAEVHKKTASGAHGYYQFPMAAEKISAVLLKIRQESV